MDDTFNARAKEDEKTYNDTWHPTAGNTANVVRTSFANGTKKQRSGEPQMAKC